MKSKVQEGRMHVNKCTVVDEGPAMWVACGHRCVLAQAPSSCGGG